MNYKLLKILPLLLILVITIGFSSCGEEENDVIEFEDSEEVIPEENPEENPNEESNTNCVLISATEETRYPSGLTGTTKVLHSPIYEINSWMGKTILKSYKEGDSSYCLFCDLPNSVSLYMSYLSDEYECALKRGLISEVKIGRETYSFKYDERNRLIERTGQYGSASEIHLEKFTYDSKYNMIGYKETRRDGEVIDEAQIEYTTIPAKTIPLQCFGNNVFGDIFIGGEWLLLEMGLYGNSIPMYLVDKISYNDTEIVYDYTLDKNGYVIKMVETKYLVSGTYINTYTFEWQAVSTLSYSNWLFSDIGSPYYRYL